MRTGEIGPDILPVGELLANQTKQDQIIAAIGGSLSDYKINDVDDDASPNYYGFTDKDENWYILKETISPGANTYRYEKGGPGGYTTAWTGRASGTYVYYYTAF